MSAKDNDVIGNIISDCVVVLLLFPFSTNV
jgi:hypothetical protein